MIIIAGNMNQCLLDVGAEVEEGIGRVISWVIIIVSIFRMGIYPCLIIRIGIRTITATIDVTSDATKDFDLGAIVYLTRDIITAINISDITSFNFYMGSIAI